MVRRFALLMPALILLVSCCSGSWAADTELQAGKAHDGTLVCENRFLDDKTVPTPTILDNLIAESRIQPMIAVLIDNPPGDARSRELPCNLTFVDFLNFELVPWVRRLFNVTHDPQQTVIGGSSYGGLAAAYAGLRHPETFGNILSQSGAYFWMPPQNGSPDDFDPNAEPNWLATRYIMSRRLPLRFYMDTGSDDIDFGGH